MGWGGKRRGAGAKPKSVVLQHPGALPTTNALPEIEEFDAPDDLSKDERDIWMKLAPHAFRRGTLTRTTAASFERFCKLVVLERKEADSSARGGPNHRGLLRLIRDLEHDFMLTPTGRPLAVPRGVPKAAPAEGNLSRFRKPAPRD